jgi:hypothetical protein
MTLIALALCGACAHASPTRTPSYRLGVRVMDHLEGADGQSTDWPQNCRNALAGHAQSFKRYNATQALAGCLDEYNTLNH